MVTVAAALREDVSDETELSLRRLYLETFPFLRATLRRLTFSGADVDDLLQDVFVVALSKRVALLTADSPRAWLYGVAVRVAKERRRRHAVWSFLGLESTAPLKARGGPHEEVERAQAEAMLQQALERLTAAKREVFVLYELDGLSGNEVAEAVGVPLNTVWSRLHAARAELEATCRELSEPAKRGKS